MTSVSLDPSVDGKVQVGLAWFGGLSAEESNPHWHEMEALAETMRRVHGGKKPSEIPGLEPARRLYRTFGVDPTRTRPSSEGLLRRVLQEKDLYRVNRLVDAVNWASLALLLPIGLYDLDKAMGSFTIRQGLEGESYEGIRRGEINLSGKLVIADEVGACGSPTADSLRTSIDDGTHHAVAMILTPADFSRISLEEGLVRMSEQIVHWCGGEVLGNFILA
ncbi:MAG: hypothetical protein HKN21_10255 [Candidatus Eisenbacteria bacterium]|uniref:B3/B4 tRNA-binding domain-containing protein n=1 Tax=Eiseniibacteriota bacterium TaxID=2212470 RepID=A0A7Y2H2L2_UNCEI|nr:hypothetical protein [Candidatus Eisenbacteria bacterium]